MAKAHAPRAGSMSVWPRRRAKRPYSKVRSWAQSKEAKPLAFAGYKVGMTTVMLVDNKKTSMTKGEEVAMPVTILECPPMKVAGIRTYKKKYLGLTAQTQVYADKLDKELERKLPKVKKQKTKLDDLKAEEVDDIVLLVYTQPKLTGIGKKKPEFFELGIGGSKEEKLAYAKEMLGKEINVTDVFAAGAQADMVGVTKGKGVQGPVRRFGISLTSHKSEKSRRTPGSLGGWKGHGHFMYRNANAGKMGFHNRVDYNKWVVKIGDKPEEVNAKGGFVRYGNVKNPYVLVKGSVMGPAKRMIKLAVARRPSKSYPAEEPNISYINTESKQ